MVLATKLFYCISFPFLIKKKKKVKSDNFVHTWLLKKPMIFN